MPGPKSGVDIHSINQIAGHTILVHRCSVLLQSAEGNKVGRHKYRIRKQGDDCRTPCSNPARCSPPGKAALVLSVWQRQSLEVSILQCFMHSVQAQDQYSILSWAYQWRQMQREGQDASQCWLPRLHLRSIHSRHTGQFRTALDCMDLHSSFSTSSQKHHGMERLLQSRVKHASNVGRHLSKNRHMRDE